MNAEPILHRTVQAADAVRLELIIIGNAGAARSKKALGRPKDLAVLPVLELPQDETRKTRMEGKNAGT